MDEYLVRPLRDFARLFERMDIPYALRLKRQLYGTEHVSLQRGVQRATEEATRLVGDLEQLRRWFPDGFGVLEMMLLNWPRP